jgi:hypothetical protein
MTALDFIQQIEQRVPDLDVYDLMLLRGINPNALQNTAGFAMNRLPSRVCFSASPR